MQECQPAALQYTGREFFVHRGRRFQGEFLRLLDDWINDVPLAPLLQLAVQERHHLVVRRSVAQQRRHRLPAGRTFVEHADIEVSVQREGQRSWDGRRTHEQRVRDRKSTRLNSSHGYISYAVFCLKKKKSNRSSRKNTQ